MKPVASIFNKQPETRKFFVMSTFGELHDVAIRLQEEGNEVVLFVPDHDYKSIGDGIVPKADNWHEYLGKGYIFVIDGCENAKLQDWLRAHGEFVVGTNEQMSELEEDRQKGQEWFREAGFNQPESHNFTDFDDAIDFVSDNSDRRWILKQNGDAQKSLNHMGKFPGAEDMLYHLDSLKKSWNESDNGSVDFDLMEVVEGTEIAASAFFNGHDWLKDEDGKVVGFLNGEEKKESDGNLGETTGETGTTFLGTDDTDDLFADILLRPEITAKLRETNYRGVFDINGSLTEDGFVAFEATSRFGVPATSYEFIEGLDMPTGDLLEIIAKGQDKPIKIHRGYGMVMVVSAKPFPLETSNIDDNSTSLGERLWPLSKGEPSDDFSKEQKNHIHLENFKKDEHYTVASKSGYLLVISGRTDDGTIEELRDSMLSYIKDNLYISGMKYRHDIGKRLEDFL